MPPWDIFNRDGSSGGLSTSFIDCLAGMYEIRSLSVGSGAPTGSSESGVITSSSEPCVSDVHLDRTISRKIHHRGSDIGRVG